VDEFGGRATASSPGANDSGSGSRRRQVVATPADINTIEMMPLGRIVFDQLVLVNDPEISKYAFYYYIPSHLTDDHPVKTVVVGNGLPRPESYTGLASSMWFNARRYADYCEEHRYAMIKLLIPGTAQYFHRELMFADPDPEDPLLRPDLEIASIIGGFIEEASAAGLDMHPRVFMTGYSNGGMQSNIFPLLHPGLVEAVAIGAAGIYAFPKAEHEGTRFPYPVGTADMDQIPAASFSAREFGKIDHFVFVGENDTKQINDPIGILDEPYESFYADSFGASQPERVAPFVEYLQSLGMNASFRIYPGLGHELSDEMFEDTFRFFDSVDLDGQIGPNRSSGVARVEEDTCGKTTIAGASPAWRPSVLFAASDEDRVTSNGLVITEDEILLRDRRTGALETAFFWSYRLDETTSTLEIEFRENPDFDFSWMTTLVCAYVVPWERGDERGYFVRNSTKRRGTNPGTDNFNVTFTHDYEDRRVEGFLFTRLMLQPGYDYRDETIITNPWSSTWSFTDRTLEYGDDRYHTILESDRP